MARLERIGLESMQQKTDQYLLTKAYQIYDFQKKREQHTEKMTVVISELQKMAKRLAALSRSDKPFNS